MSVRGWSHANSRRLKDPDLDFGPANTAFRKSNAQDRIGRRTTSVHNRRELK